MSGVQFVMLQTTCDHRQPLVKIADELVAGRLAACVQISGPVESVYTWHGGRESSEEYLLAAKTRSDLFDRAAELVGSLHPYELPEIIALPISNCSAAYGAWMNEHLG